jgi:hypothetical protein
LQTQLGKQASVSPGDRSAMNSPSYETTPYDKARLAKAGLIRRCFVARKIHFRAIFAGETSSFKNLPL